MERRTEPRLIEEQSVQVTLLGDHPQSFCGKTLDASGRGLRLATVQHIPAGSALKLEMDDSILLAEVCYCVPSSEGFVSGLKVDQALRGLTALAALNRRLLGDSRGIPVGVGEYEVTTSRS